MKLLAPAFIRKDLVPLKIHNGNLVAVQGDKLVLVEKKGQSEIFKNRISSTFLSKCVADVPLLRRCLREGVHFYEFFKEKHIVFRKNHIDTYDKSGVKVGTFQNFEGSRPLNVCAGPSDLIFGEYFGNPDRKEVRIFGTSDGSSWKEYYRFPPGRIRHIHGIQYDAFRQGFWVLSGDSDDESALWFTSDGFKSLELCSTGSQSSRAVSIHVLERDLIVPSDTPLEKNYIRSFSLLTHSFQAIEPLPGSAFHCAKVGEIFFITTVTESSEVNTVTFAAVYASLDGFRWHCIARLTKDLFPVSMQKLTRYSEVRILDGIWQNEFIVAAGRALSCVSEGGVFWRYADVHDLLLSQTAITLD